MAAYGVKRGKTIGLDRVVDETYEWMRYNYFTIIK